MEVNLQPIIVIVGAFITLGLGINAFFLKGIYTDLNDVKVEIAKIFAGSKDKDRRIAELEENEKDLYNKVNELSQRVHTLEGGQKQLLMYIESEAKKINKES